MASNFSDSYLSQLPKGRSFPVGVAFLMPGLGVIKKADPPKVEQVNEACAKAFHDSLAQTGKMCPAGAQPKFIQLLFAQAFMVGKDLHCLCVIQWEIEKATKQARPKPKSKVKSKARSNGKATAKPAKKPKSRR
jgi:hypothetical protein